ncbi:MAG: EAL domain-containing protein [Phreatobacter sp.]|uniref:putative bifunctional diguanylate cyclase/phosphodiesterase n=1 Tax=Phreatobacter sp. TaxID=1966341 RepID=UPI0027339E82|nr:EAL domain-containing protein [Phreatobacter sp.]MDP2802418.1 EAL domain-containing protein [Phreatobacter sp.]
MRELPVEIYVSMVDSLYEDVRSLLLGVVAALAGTIYTAHLTGHPLLIAFPFAIVLIGFVRTLRMVAYRRVRTSVVTYEQALRWEREYTIGANMLVFTIGLWCFATFNLTQSMAAHLFCVSVALSYMVGVTGRNFANGPFVDNQIALLCAPLVVGMMMTGVWDYMVLACFAIPFFGSVRSIARRLREILLNAIIAKRDVSLLADRFDTALTNMPHGLAMFDAEGRLVVVNRRWAQILPLDPDSLAQGARAEAIIAAYVDLGILGERDAGRVLDAVARRVHGLTREQFELQANGCNVDLTFQPMETGGLVVAIEDITEKRRTEARIAHMARHDALTGLPNRSLFQERLETALAMTTDEDMLAVLFVDLDHFQQVNDTLGHTAGDALLVEVADRLRFAVGENDVVARFGADEFVILQNGARSVNDVTTLAARIIETIADISQIDDKPIASGASVGIALAPRDGREPDQLLKSADMALSRAKAGGRGILHFYEEEMDRQAQARRAIEMDLRKAIQNEDLAVYFQPMLDLKSLTISTCEALARWPHRVRGMISPAEFIPIAEETGLVIELGRQVLRKACRACVAWPDRIRVSVNLSSVQFERDDVVALVAETLRTTGLDPDRLELEITETLLLQDSEGVLSVLTQLRAMGVRLALDDFGTGYSSLSYLHKFPLDKVKIDRSFVRNITSDKKAAKLLRGVTRLGSELGLSVVVEGVETLEQLKLIDAPGVVSEVQGFVLSPAIPDDQLRALMGRSGKDLLARAA